MPSLGISILIARPYLIGFMHMGPTPTRSKTAEIPNANEAPPVAEETARL